MVRNKLERSRGVLTLVSLFMLSLVPAVSKADFDFNNDGLSDVLFQHQSSGDIYYTLMNGTVPISGDFLLRGEDTQWKIVASPDINGDGQADLLWENQATGDVWYSILNGIALDSGDYLLRGMDLNWQIAGTADLFGNGVTDIIWQNQRNGDVYYSPLNGTTVDAGDYIFSNIDPNWKIKAITSTNDPRYPGVEMIWQHKVTGDLSYTDVSGVTVTGGGYLNQNVPPEWVVAGSAVLSGLGDSDLIFENRNNGDVYASPISGSYLDPGGYLFTGIDTNWKLVGLTSETGGLRQTRASHKRSL